MNEAVLTPSPCSIQMLSHQLLKDMDPSNRNTFRSVRKETTYPVTTPAVTASPVCLCITAHNHVHSIYFEFFIKHPKGTPVRMTRHRSLSILLGFVCVIQKVKSLLEYSGTSKYEFNPFRGLSS